MLEPAPKKIPLPTQENIIKVGLILPEDKLDQVSITSKQNVLLNGLLVYAENANFLIRANGDKLELAGKLYTEIKLKPAQETELTKNCGLLVSPVIAGRNFHWKKQISASYPGELELSVEAGQIKLINILPFEKYLACVATSEMSSECPVEFMKAQIIAARSWAYVFLKDKHPDSGFDVCNDDDCQRYQGSTFLSENSLEACRKTMGQYLQIADTGYVLPAYYIKTCGGLTEETKAIFGFQEESLIPVSDSESKISYRDFTEYLNQNPQNIFCGQADSMQIEKYLGKVDSGGSHFRWQKNVTNQELKNNLSRLADVNDFKKLTDIKILSRSVSYRINSLEVIYLSSDNQTKALKVESQYRIRELLSPDFLPSSAFNYHINQQGDITFKGAGWGHGVGLCQVGAVVMALKGYSSDQILKHYFPKSVISRTY